MGASVLLGAAGYNLILVTLAYVVLIPGLSFAGLDSSISTRHSVLLCMTLAPLGLLAHAVTKVRA